MRSHGFSLVEGLVVVFLITTLMAVVIPLFRPLFAEAHLMGAAQEFRGTFRWAATSAIRGNVYTAIRFEPDAEDMYYSVYRDGNRNGVLTADILSGDDPRIAGPIRLTMGSTVRLGFLPGTPAIPPDSGALSGDAVRFGRSDILSFSPLGNATPGTLYLAGDAAQAAIRVTPGSARVRLFVCRGGRWRER